MTGIFSFGEELVEELALGQVVDDLLVEPPSRCRGDHVGDSLKLSSDAIARVGEGGAPAEDMRALGVVLVQALTQEQPKIEDDAGPYILREASQLFTDIVRHCLDGDPDKRWTVDQVQARLDAPLATPVPALGCPGIACPGADRGAQADH